jgi:hypothetical protein
METGNALLTHENSSVSTAAILRFAVPVEAMGKNKKKSQGCTMKFRVAPRTIVFGYEFGPMISGSASTMPTATLFH